MYKNRFNNRNNVCGVNIARIRKSMVPKMSQRALSEKLQLVGLDIDKNAIQRIECGKRFVTDIELVFLARVFKMSIDDLLFIPSDMYPNIDFL